MILFSAKHKIEKSFTQNHNSYLHETKVVCDFCGAVFRLIHVKQKGCNSERIYHCPECAKEFYINAASPVSNNCVVLISPRIDGKTIKYRHAL